MALSHPQEQRCELVNKSRSQQEQNSRIEGTKLLSLWEPSSRLAPHVGNHTLHSLQGSQMSNLSCLIFEQQAEPEDRVPSAHFQRLPVPAISQSWEHGHCRAGVSLQGEVYTVA
jgi:hypothetical protein